MRVRAVLEWSIAWAAYLAGREQGPWADLTIQSPTGVSTDLYSNSPRKVRCTSAGRPTFTVAVSKP